MPSFLLCIACLCGSLLPAAGDQPAGQKSDKLVAEGNAFQRKGNLNEALRAYCQAAKAGSPTGAFAAGQMLMAQAQAKSGRERLLNLNEGLEYLFFAATNFQPEACAQLAEAFQSGIGVQTNLVMAYAWLEVAAKDSTGFRADLDRLVVRLEPPEILQAQKLGREYISGRWPARITRQVDQGDPRLQIQGLSVTSKGTLIILNGDTLTVGESINVLPAGKQNGKSGQKLSVSCREIGADYALVAVAGETNLKLLSIATR